jgi:hypothetical protein
MVPEDRERWIKIKIGRDSILESHWSVSLAGYTTSIRGTGAVCNEKILVFGAPNGKIQAEHVDGAR